MNFLTTFHSRMPDLLRSVVISFFVLAYLVSFADDFPPRPSPPRLVNDMQQTMSVAEREALERKLVNYYDSTSTQIAIVTLKSVGEYDLSDYSFRLAEKWGIGEKGKDNGILILAAIEDRNVFIASGYGMEDVVPDALAKRIVENYLLPNFRNGDYYEGFDQASNAIIGLASGKYTADDLGKRKKDGINIFTVLIILAIIIFSSIFSRRRRSYTYSGRGVSGPRGIFWGGGGFGGGGSSGGGGGFGGFGGGSFGGGGAGGSW